MWARVYHNVVRYIEEDDGLARGAVTGPCLTAILTVRNAQDHVLRALESIISQQIRSLQVLVVDCASTDRTLDICQRMAEREFCVDVIALQDPDIEKARMEGLKSARGAFVVFMDADTWFAKESLSVLLDKARTHDASMIFSNRAYDICAPDGSTRSRFTTVPQALAHGTEEVARSLSWMIDLGLFDSLNGCVCKLDLLRRAYLETKSLSDDTSLLATCMRYATDVAFVSDATVHLREEALPRAFDPVMFEKSVHAHEALIELAQGLSAGEAISAADRWFFGKVVRCIETACLGSRKVSSNERIAHVRDMVDADDTRRAVDALRPHSRDLGIMYAPIAKRNVAACCMSAWISNLLHISKRADAAAAVR